MRVSIKKIIMFGLGAFYSHLSFLYGFAPVNFYRPDEALLRLPHVQDTKLKFWANIEAGNRSTGLASDGTRKNILALADEIQRVIPLRSNVLSSDIQQRIQGTSIFDRTGIPPQRVLQNDALQRGFTLFSGNFSEIDVTLNMRGGMPFKSIFGGLYVDFILPIKSKKITDVNFTDLTKKPGDAGFNANQGDRRVASFITNLITNAQNISNLDLSSLNKSGIGDLMILLNWDQHFREEEEFARDLSIYFKIGVSCPTGDTKDEDRAFSMPFGYDGSWGLPVGIGFSMELVQYLKLGVDVDFLPLFDETRSRRVKTRADQTEFLLMNKANVTKKPGFTWEIDPYIQIYRYAQGLSIKLGYQYVHHDIDKLVLKDKDFETKLIGRPADEATQINPAVGNRITDPNALINTANSLKAWDVHNLILQLNWDVAECVKDVPGAPQLSFFYKWPFDGKNIIDTPTLGGQIGFNF